MTTTQAAAPQPLWSGWKTLAIITMLFGFSVLIGLTAEAYRQAPPIPERVVDPAGKTLFTRDDVRAGQQVFLKYGLMANGTIWGHGAYLGPDFSATYLHNWAIAAADRAAQARYQRPYAGLTPEQRTVLLLISVEGVAYREAAEILQLPIGTVMSRLARARLALGKALEEPRRGSEPKGSGANVIKLR